MSGYDEKLKYIRATGVAHDLLVHFVAVHNNVKLIALLAVLKK